MTTAPQSEVTSEISGSKSTFDTFDTYDLMTTDFEQTGGELNLEGGTFFTFQKY